MATLTISLPTTVVKQVDAELRQKKFSTRSEFFRDLLRKYFSGELRFERYEFKPLEQVRLELARSGRYSEKFIESVVSGLAKLSGYAN